MSPRPIKTCCRTKMTSEERFNAILDAAAPLFAEKGFEGTTTREIAEAAKVSEALLYRHFSSKKELYKQLFMHFCDYDGTRILNLLETFPTSTDKIIFIVFLLFAEIFYKKTSENDETKIILHLSLRSLLEDGQFFKTLLETKLLLHFEDIITLIHLAKDEDSFEITSFPEDLSIWFVHHLAFTLGLMSLPSPDFLEYQCSREERLLQALRFSLRGMGIKNQIIEEKVNAAYVQKGMDLLKN